MYGSGTRSYNRSPEKRAMERERRDMTAKYEAGELKLGKTIVGPICACRSFRFPHELAAHKQLLSDSDWRLPEERRNQDIWKHGMY